MLGRQAVSSKVNCPSRNRNLWSINLQSRCLCRSVSGVDVSISCVHTPRLKAGQRLSHGILLQITPSLSYFYEKDGTQPSQSIPPESVGGGRGPTLTSHHNSPTHWAFAVKWKCPSRDFQPLSFASAGQCCLGWRVGVAQPRWEALRKLLLPAGCC